LRIRVELFKRIGATSRHTKMTIHRTSRERVRMNLLDYVRNQGEARQEGREVEYRLLVSGTLFRDHVLGDWEKSDVARPLLGPPFPITVFVSASRMTDNPQELCVRLPVSMETLVAGNEHLMHYPDDEIVADVAAFLTAVARRPVSVVGKTRTMLPPVPNDRRPSDWPSPIFNLPAKHWAPRGVSIGYSMDGVSVRYNDPPPVPLDPPELARQLDGLARANAEHVLRAIRLYATALDLVPERPEIAHILLVSVVEILAAAEFEDWAPSENDQVEMHSAVVKQARSFGLSTDQARALAITAAKRERWIKRKFVNLILQYAGEDLWSEDDLFPGVQLWRPDRMKVRRYLSWMYDTRSQTVHQGIPLPLGSTVGTSHLIDVLAYHDFTARGPDGTPLLAWFERAVSLCLRATIRSYASDQPMPDEEELPPSAPKA
jgi:hypothetical protein